MSNSEIEEKKETVRQEWIEYRNAVNENKSKSQDDFEKYINLLASGGLVLSLTFFEKIVPLDKAIYKPFVVIGMFLMVVTLLSNLYSHHKSILDSDATIKEIDEEKFKEIFKNIDERNKAINTLNSVSIWALIIGMLSLITFVTINIYSMDNTNKGNKPSPQQPPKPLTEEKRGRTTPPPPQRPSDNPKK